MKLTYNSIEKAYAKKGYKFFKGHMNLNTGFVRMDDIFTNTYSDVAFNAYQKNGKNILEIYDGSTKAGHFWVKNPVTHEGVTGVAVVLEGQTKMQWVDGKDNFHQSAHLAQIVEAVRYYRDTDKDMFIDRNAPISTGYIGVNCHWANGSYVERWSAGCLVVAIPGYFEWASTIRQSVAIYGKIITLSVKRLTMH